MGANLSAMSGQKWVVIQEITVIKGLFYGYLGIFCQLFGSERAQVE